MIFLHTMSPSFGLNIPILKCNKKHLGNYGNKLDNSVSPRPSTTPPTNPVFDGEKYYYLPWANSKPYVRIDCDWEDICFRLGALNKLLKMSGNLVRLRD